MTTNQLPAEQSMQEKKDNPATLTTGRM